MNLRPESIKAQIQENDPAPDAAEEVYTAIDEPAAGPWWDFLWAKTGPGPVADYIDHPLNYARSESLARVVRGATGLLGDLDLALVDIALGVLEYMRPDPGGEEGSDDEDGATLGDIRSDGER